MCLADNMLMFRECMCVLSVGLCVCACVIIASDSICVRMCARKSCLSTNIPMPV